MCLNNTFISDPQVKKELTIKIRNFFEMNENEHIKIYGIQLRCLRKYKALNL